MSESLQKLSFGTMALLVIRGVTHGDRGKTLINEGIETSWHRLAISKNKDCLNQR